MCGLECEARLRCLRLIESFRSSLSEKYKFTNKLNVSVAWHEQGNRNRYGSSTLLSSNRASVFFPHQNASLERANPGRITIEGKRPEGLGS
jgi:hypothetical protein